MKYCKNCGKQIAIEDNFCYSCGHNNSDTRRGGSYSESHYDVELSPYSWIATLLLCIFLGCWGIHRFYVGKVGTGLLMLFTIGGLGIWAFIDFIFILTNNFTDENGKLVKQ